MRQVAGNYGARYCHGRKPHDIQVLVLVLVLATSTATTLHRLLNTQSRNPS